jgi:cytochrome P450
MNRFPPGPKGFLTLLRIARRSGTDPLGCFLDLARIYGDLIMPRIGPVRFCLVNHPDLVREVLVHQTKSFRKPERLKRNLAKVVGNGLLTNEGDSWLRQRRLVQPAFHSHRMERYAEIVVDKTRRMTADWPTAKGINIADAMTHLTLTIIAQALSERRSFHDRGQARGNVLIAVCVLNVDASAKRWIYLAFEKEIGQNIEFKLLRR